MPTPFPSLGMEVWKVNKSKPATAAPLAEDVEDMLAIATVTEGLLQDGFYGSPAPTIRHDRPPACKPWH